MRAIIILLGLLSLFGNKVVLAQVFQVQDIEYVVEQNITPEKTSKEIIYSEYDAELIARSLWTETRGESYEGQLLVAQCIIDRVESGAWGDTVEDVLISSGEFARLGIVTPELKAVAVEALQGKRFDDSVMILYFKTSKSTKDWYAPYLGRYGGHSYYGYKREDK